VGAGRESAGTDKRTSTPASKIHALKNLDHGSHGQGEKKGKSGVETIKNKRQYKKKRYVAELGSLIFCESRSVLRNMNRGSEIVGIDVEDENSVDAKSIQSSRGTERGDMGSSSGDEKALIAPSMDQLRGNGK